MAENLNVNNSLSLNDKYEFLFKQLEHLLMPNEKLISNLSNFTAALNQTFDKISWVGFYLANKEEKNLYLGPFQGKIACTIIPFGSGFCGSAVKEKRTIIVEDVSKFAGHIACDADTKSEIVVPIFLNNELFGVLDIDSAELNSFNEIDKINLEKMCKFISTNIINKTDII